MTAPDEPTIKTADALQPGGVLWNRYEIKGILGRGAMGEVLEVHDRQSGIDYALKRVPHEMARKADLMDSIRRNFQLVSRLTHPHIATSRFIETDPGTGAVCLIMDLVRGTSLADWIKAWRERQGDPDAPMPLDLALDIARQIGEALDYAHTLPVPGTEAKGILHQDLKPTNVMVEAGREAAPGVPFIKLVDFGLAAEIQASITALSMNPTRSDISGTPSYMAPEQWTGRTLTAAVDQWALAVMIYEMAEGIKPFSGPTLGALRDAVVMGEASKPQHLDPAAFDVLAIALRKDRKARFRSCQAMVEAIRHKKAEAHSILAAQSATASTPAAATPAAGSAAQSATGAKSSGLVFGIVAAFLAVIVLGGCALGGLWWILKGRKQETAALSSGSSSGGTTPFPFSGSSDQKPAPPLKTVETLDPIFVGSWRVSNVGGDLEDWRGFAEVFPDGQCLIIRYESFHPQGFGASVKQERGMLEAKDGQWVLSGAGQAQGKYEVLDSETIRTTGNLGLVVWKRTEKEELVDPRIAGKWRVYFFLDRMKDPENLWQFDYGPGDGSMLILHGQGFYENTVLGMPVGGRFTARDGRVEAKTWSISGDYYLQAARAKGYGKVVSTYEVLDENRIKLDIHEVLGPDAKQMGAWFSEKRRQVWYVRLDEHDREKIQPALPMPMIPPALVGRWQLVLRQGPKVDRVSHLGSKDNTIMEIGADGQYRTYHAYGRRWLEWRKIRALDDQLLIYHHNVEARGSYRIASQDEWIYQRTDYGGVLEKWKRVRP